MGAARREVFGATVAEFEAALERGVPVSDDALDLFEQVSGGEWVERAPYFEAIAVNGDGVFDTLKAVSKLVLKALA